MLQCLQVCPNGYIFEVLKEKENYLTPHRAQVRVKKAEAASDWKEMIKYFKKPVYVGKNEEGFLFVHKVDMNDSFGPTAYGHTRNKNGKVVMNWSVDLDKANLPKNWRQWE